MAFNIPTTKELFDQFLATFEANLAQTSPLLPKSYLRVESAAQAAAVTLLAKFAANRAIQNLALTAGEGDLEIIGREYGVIRKAAVANQTRISQPANNGTTIPVTIFYTGDSNNVQYRPLASAVAAGGVAIVDVQAIETGTAGNLIAGDTLTISTQIAGITSTTANYVETLRLGTDKEDLEDYRRRVLNEIRTQGGGSNNTDHRTWAEAVEGVRRAFPFSGAPIDETTKLKDADCNLPTATYWSDGNDADLSKEVDPFSPTEYRLKVAYDGTNEPFAYQQFLTYNREYEIQGDGGGDGTFAWEIRDSDGNVFYTGLPSATPQSFSFDFIPTGSRLEFYSLATSAGHATFNNIIIKPKRSYPGDRVVYIEADETIDADGIPPQTLLDDVRDNINTDPATGEDRPVLGTTDEFLFVERIKRTQINIEINGVVYNDPSVQSEAETSVEDGLSIFLRSIAPYVQGIDAEFDKNDTVSTSILGQVVQDILDAFEGTAQEIKFKVAGGSYITLYTVDENELLKLGTLTFG
jgi:hypothetical protein